MDKLSNTGSRAEWLSGEVRRLEAINRPASSGEVAEHLGLLFVALPSQAKSEQEDDLRARIYVAALANVPIGALKPLVSDILSGSDPSFGATWVPTPPELARACRIRAAKLVRDIERRRLELRHLAEKAIAPPHPSPAARAAETKRRAEKVARATALIGEVVASADMQNASARPPRQWLSETQIARALAFIEREDAGGHGARIDHDGIGEAAGGVA